MAASLSILHYTVRKALLNRIRNPHECKFVCFSSIVAQDINVTKNDAAAIKDRAESVIYPPIKPQYPPGKWGDMKPSYAWLWQNTIDDLMSIDDVKRRQDLIINKEMSHLNVLPYHDHPNYLDFAKYATKTALFPWSEMPNHHYQSGQELDEQLIAKMKKAIVDQILIEHESVEREFSRDGKSPTSNSKHKQAKLVLRCIFDTLITSLSGVANHLRSCQYDEDVTVRAVWDRHGIERKRKHRLSPTHFKNETVDDQRLMSSCLFNGMIRSHLPLPQFQPRDFGVSIESEKPALQYKPLHYGVSKTSMMMSESIIAGHNLGDPCEYGLVGFLLTNRKVPLESQFGTEAAKHCRLGRGLASTFTWLAAQAYNQGFSGFIDLSYPLSSQTILTDGRIFSLIACQLNTLELWKCDKANSMVNLCWYTDEMPLFECIENGQVKGFNDDALKILIDVFLLEPSDRGYDMKPTISEKEDDVHLKCDFIPKKVEIMVEKEEERFIV